VIHTLLETPGMAQRAMELYYPRIDTTYNMEEVIDYSCLSGDPVMDYRTIKAVTHRLIEISNDMNAPWVTEEMKEAYHEEQDQLTDYLSDAGRNFSDVAERARSTVSKSIGRAIEKVGEHSPDIAQHLSDGIITGNECCYSPKIIFHWNLKMSQI
jgi:hypothetical protein